MTCMFKAIHYHLQMYWKTLERSALKYMNLILLIFFFCTGVSMVSLLKKTGAKLELLTDINMLLMVEKGIRSRMCQAIQRYAKADNKYMKNYDKNIVPSYLMYLDANNLYGWAISQKLPVNGFKWVEDLS